MNKRKWTRTETRVVRPFTEGKDLLSNCLFRLDQDSDFFSKELFNLDDIDQEEFSPALKLQIPVDQIKSTTGLEPELLLLIVIVNDPMIMRSEIVYEIPVHEFEEEVYEIPPEKLTLFSWKSRTNVDIALTLAEDLDREFGKPFLKGHWVARKSFKLRKSSEGVIFPVKPLDGEGFKARGYPKDTLYLIDVVDLDVGVEDIEQNVSIYIHEDVYYALIRAESFPAGKLSIKLLLAEFIATILSIGLKNLDGVEPRENTVIKNLLEKFRDDSGYEISKIKEFAKVQGYPGLKALAQSIQGLTRLFVTCNFRGG